MICRLICLLTLALSASNAAWSESKFLDFSAIHLPNYVGLGVGGANQYVGAVEYIAGLVPFARKNLSGTRYLSLQGNYATANVIDHPNWQVGPAGLLRFGRDDVKDEVVDTLPSINPTVELGGFVSWQYISPDDPRDRWQFAGSVTQDVLDVHGGYVANISARRFVGVGRFAIAGLALASSFGSEDYSDTYFSVTENQALPAFDAGAGVRDLRLQFLFVQPLSFSWSVGGGFQYQYLLGDAADSPITEERGNRNQLLFGVGIAH
ncbi:MAG: MipA/OmpV family protein, partial [Pseudomonadota bacterium]